MFRVSHEKLIEILNTAECGVALECLEAYDLSPDQITAIEIDFTVDDEGTEDEITTVSEFNIYTRHNVVFFGAPLKHESDFTVQWARTCPHPDSTILREIDDKAPETFKSLTDRLELARGKVGDLSRVIEKQCGDSEADDEINERLDEIYTILKGSE